MQTHDTPRVSAASEAGSGSAGFTGRAVSATRRGGPDVLKLITRHVDPPRPDEIVIEMHAAGVALGDFAVREGLQPSVKLPAIPGFDAAGIVRAVGANVSDLHPGDHAVVRTDGTGGYATHIRVSRSCAAPYSAHLDPAARHRRTPMRAVRFDKFGDLEVLDVREVEDPLRWPVVGLDFWFLPGGRVEMLESASQALVREIQEELDVRAEVDRLLWVVENFFSLGGRRYHELGLYFAVQLPRSVPMDREFPARDPHAELVMRWLPASNLGDAPIQPSFLRTVLAAPPETPRHVVHYDAGWSRID